MLSEGEREKERGDFFKRKKIYIIYIVVLQIFIF